VKTARLAFVAAVPAVKAQRLAGDACADEIARAHHVRAAGLIERAAVPGSAGSAGSAGAAAAAAPARAATAARAAAAMRIVTARGKHQSRKEKPTHAPGDSKARACLTGEDFI